MKRIALALLAGVAAVGVASASQAADLMIDPAPVYMAPVASGGNWDGPYIGAFVGYGWGTLGDEFGYINDGPAEDFDVDGWLLGVTAGANFTLSEAIVAGIAGDIAWSNIGGEFDGSDYDLTADVNWVGSIRGRLGFDGGQFLPYVTAGLAFANMTLDDEDEVDTQTHIGWTVGAGVEFAVADNVSLDLQYRYSDYGTQTYEIDSDTDFSLTTHAITAGINFRF
jgi:outer membrane immunogenic protein